MKILQLMSSGGFYGAEAMLLHLSTALRSKGHQVRVGVFLNRSNPHDEVARRARQLGFEVAEFPCRGKWDLAAVGQLRAYAAASGSEILHSHGYKSNLYALAASAGTRNILISTCHNWTDRTLALRIYKRIDCAGLRFFHRVICVSPEIRRRLLRSGIPEKKVAVIWNGISVSDFLPREQPFGDRAKDSPLTIGMVGRLVEEKGFHLVLQCAPALVKQFPQVRFVLVGDGPERDRWVHLSRSLGIEAYVRFAGVETNMPSRYRSFDALVLPSFNEGMPMTILEGMAAGLPVLATRVGSIPDVIRQEETGLLVHPGDLNGLALGLERLISDANLRATLGRRARQFVMAHASIEQAADQYVSHYEELARKRAG